jgi:ribosome recycling factor
MVKKAKSLGEEAKVSVRTARHKAMESLKKAVKDGIPEDIGKKKENEVQEMTNQFSKKIDHLLEVKEKDIMTV